LILEIVATLTLQLRPIDRKVFPSLSRRLIASRPPRDAADDDKPEPFASAASSALGRGYGSGYGSGYGTVAV
jgi:hypothetical protein